MNQGTIKKKKTLNFSINKVFNSFSAIFIEGVWPSANSLDLKAPVLILIILEYTGNFKII